MSVDTIKPPRPSQRLIIEKLINGVIVTDSGFCEASGTRVFNDFDDFCEWLYQHWPKETRTDGSWTKKDSIPPIMVKYSDCTYATPSAAPAIGSVWQGGIYAGVMRGGPDGKDYHLIVGPELESRVTWTDAKTLASWILVDEFNDYCLPTRKEQALCFANAGELFKPDCYWSCEEHAAYGDYGAWCQDFFGGNQHYWLKVSDYRARAVRRVKISQK